jgi:hypothetical protein
MAVIAVALSEPTLEGLVFGCQLRRGAQVAAEEQGELLGEASRDANVDVGPRVPAGSRKYRFVCSVLSAR